MVTTSKFQSASSLTLFEARDSVANEYLKNADAVFLVAIITRAKDDPVRDAHCIRLEFSVH
jgi:hypothetical protein